MPKAKPIDYVATRFKISAESARYFLSGVQKSFKTERPTHQVIVEFMQSQKFKTLPRPYQVAAMMSDYGIWAHPMNSEPHVAEDEPDIYF
jgi:hypothetical protein